MFIVRSWRSWLFQCCPWNPIVGLTLPPWQHCFLSHFIPTSVFQWSSSHQHQLDHINTQNRIKAHSLWRRESKNWDGFRCSTWCHKVKGPRKAVLLPSWKISCLSTCSKGRSPIIMKENQVCHTCHCVTVQVDNRSCRPFFQRIGNMFMKWQTVAWATSSLVELNNENCCALFIWLGIGHQIWKHWIWCRRLITWDCSWQMLKTSHSPGSGKFKCKCFSNASDGKQMSEWNCKPTLLVLTVNSCTRTCCINQQRNDWNNNWSHGQVHGDCRNFTKSHGCISQTGCSQIANCILPLIGWTILQGGFCQAALSQWDILGLKRMLFLKHVFKIPANCAFHNDILEEWCSNFCFASRGPIFASRTAWTMSTFVKCMLLQGWRQIGTSSLNHGTRNEERQQKCEAWMNKITTCWRTACAVLVPVCATPPCRRAFCEHAAKRSC